MDLKWEKPDGDGGAPITSYLIEFKDKFSTEWAPAKEVPVTDILQATVDGLKEGMAYEFRIRAVNKAGPGEPSEPTKPVIAKSRFGKIYIYILFKLAILCEGSLQGIIKILNSFEFVFNSETVYHW